MATAGQTTTSGGTSTSAVGDESTSDAPQSTGLVETSTGAGESTETGDPSTTTGAPPTQQPDEGMYSPCLSPLDCIGLTTCLTATDTSNQPIDAFCTAGSCTSPLAQCDATPGGTAVPICLPIQLGDTMDEVCALDCSAGQTCPTGMECRTLAAGAICS